MLSSLIPSIMSLVSDVSGLISGLLHPVLGFDHLLAMVAVGLLSVQLGHKHIWSLPTAFVAFLAIGGLMGLVGIPLIQVEGIISLSVMVLGVAIASGRSVASLYAYPMVAIFAIFHGHAHGEEVPFIDDPWTYVVGFVLASAILHIIGVSIGLIVRSQRMRSLLGAGCAGIGLHMILLTYAIV